MRILVLSQYFWPESFRINEFIDSLYEEGCEITVLTGQPNYPEGKIFKGYNTFSFKHEIHNGYKIIRVPMIPRGKANALRLFINYVSFIISASIFAPFLLFREKYDAIFVYAPSPILQVIPAIILKKIKGTPLITWIGDLWPQSLISTGFIKNSYILKFIEKIVRFIYKNNDLLLVQSRPFIEPVKNIAGNVPVQYFPNPGETMFSKPGNSDDIPGYTLKEGFNIVFAGNIGSVQSIKMILESAMLIKDEPLINMYLFGSGSMSDWLKNEIEVKQLKNILLPGRFSPVSMPAILAQADVLLVSLIKDETMSLTVPAKVQSYLAAGKPIIAALDGEGAKVVTEAGAGVYTPAEDAESLAKTIINLKNCKKEDLKQMGESGFNYYKENFDSKVLCQKFIKYINEIQKN